VRGTVKGKSRVTVMATIGVKVREFSKVVFYGLHLIVSWVENKKNRTEAVASIRACVIANRRSGLISRIRIPQHIDGLLCQIASGEFPTQHGGIVASKAWVGNASGPGSAGPGGGSGGAGGDPWGCFCY
jgi:hypothetical protein